MQRIQVAARKISCKTMNFPVGTTTGDKVYEQR
jgi:hypothetical protein